MLKLSLVCETPEVLENCKQLIAALDIPSIFEGAIDPYNYKSTDEFFNIVSNATAEEEDAVLSGSILDVYSTIMAADKLREKMKADGRGDYNIFAIQKLPAENLYLQYNESRLVKARVVMPEDSDSVFEIPINNLIIFEHLNTVNKIKRVIEGRILNRFCLFRGYFKGMLLLTPYVQLEEIK